MHQPYVQDLDVTRRRMAERVTASEGIRLALAGGWVEPAVAEDAGELLHVVRLCIDARAGAPCGCADDRMAS